jgi:hypothetical protein
LSNGGFYPPNQVAEFEQSYYPNSLRKYAVKRFPADFARPVATAQARSMSKNELSKKHDDYLNSQVFYVHDDQIKH